MGDRFGQFRFLRGVVTLNQSQLKSGHQSSNQPKRTAFLSFPAVFVKKEQKTIWLFVAHLRHISLFLILSRLFLIKFVGDSVASSFAKLSSLNFVTAPSTTAVVAASAGQRGREEKLVRRRANERRLVLFNKLAIDQRAPAIGSLSSSGYTHSIVIAGRIQRSTFVCAHCHRSAVAAVAVMVAAPIIVPQLSPAALDASRFRLPQTVAAKETDRNGVRVSW